MLYIKWDKYSNAPILNGSKGYDLIPIEVDVRIALKEEEKRIKKILKEYRYSPNSSIVISRFPYTDWASKLYADGILLGKLFFDGKLKFIPSAALASLVEPDVILKLPKMRIKGKKFDIKVNIDKGYFIFYDENSKSYGVAKNLGNKIKVVDAVKHQFEKLPRSTLKDWIRINKEHLENIENRAIELIERYKNFGEFKFAAFSGGKDSTVVSYLSKDYVDEIIFIDTGFEHEETKEFVKTFEKFIGKDITVLSPKGNFWEEVKKRGFPTKDNRWCTEFLKLNPLREHLKKYKEVLSFEGVRKYESYSRAKYPYFRKNPFIPNAYQVFPILDWNGLELWLYIFYRKIPYNPLYDLGMERIGCYFCPAMLQYERYILKMYNKKVWNE